MCAVVLEVSSGHYSIILVLYVQSLSSLTQVEISIQHASLTDHVAQGIIHKHTSVL